DYIEYILNYPIEHEPGTFFVYNNAATYLLSAIIQRLSGKSLDDWVYEAVLRHMGIEKPQWEKTAQGICLGATGLHFNNEEVHRIGLLLLNRGKYEGCQIIDGSWVDAMHQPHILNPGHEKFNSPGNRCLKKVAYGYHIWVCEDGSNEKPATHYFCDGAEGQFLIVAPEQRMVLTMLSREKNTDMLYGIICDCITDSVRHDV
ncbi:MAG: serine hydrolase, partial [Clostridiales bacterium]|nr:serine hydrolase [Clostridiales bacterium]